MAYERREHMNGFEEFLKESTDDFQMTPSEDVWNTIHHELHTTPRWPYYTLTLIFISLGVLTNIIQSQKVEYAGIKPSSLAHTKSTQTLANTVSKKASSTTIFTELSFNGKKSLPGKFDNKTIKEKSIIESERKQYSSVKIDAPSKTSSEIKNLLAVLDKSTKDLSTRPIQLMSQPILSDPRNLKSEYRVPVTNFNQIRTSEKVAIKPQKINSYKNSNPALAIKLPRNKKNAWAFYFSPTVSYRKLHGTAQAFNNYSFTRTDVNSAVFHLPMMGMEIGSAYIFNAQNKIRFRIGLQLNLNQYDIRAYNAVPEVTSLNVSGIGQTPIKTIAYHRTFDGFKETWLKNKHIMISIPMATELRIMGNQKLSLNIAAGMQPTYMLSENPYLISSNLKNYAKAPSDLLRDLNVNGSLESFVSFKSGSIRWTMGPQFRYQLLSNFKKTYPFKEHLTDLGFKVGIIKSIK
ncbi:MAG: hypothetical protein ACO29O_08535 [Chitinophagaceae bacterium]